MSGAVRAMVQTGPGQLELQTFPRPVIGADDALLRVEACGICGSDYEQFEGAFRTRYPLIPGHEPLGFIEAIGAEASRRWGVQAGDRVVVETMLPCGSCRACRAGEYRLCSGRRGLSAYGYFPTDVPPALWGGYAEYMYLDPNSIVHPIDPAVPAELAVMFNPMGAGIRWAVQIPGTTVGSSVVILGPGQRGLCSVIACKEAGAGCIIVTGLASDAHKLELARAFGADHTIDVTADDPVRRVREITDGRGADVVVDVTAYAVEPVAQALDMARRGGTVVLAGTKGPKPVPHFLSDKIVTRELTVKGAMGVDFRAYEPAIRLIESRRYPLERMHTHSFPLERAERAIRTLAGEIEGERAVHVALMP